MDITSVSAVLGARVSIVGCEGGIASLGAFVTSIGDALLTEERRGVVTRWYGFGVSPAFLWDKEEAVLPLVDGQHGVSAHFWALGLSSSRASHIEVRGLSLV